MKDVTASDLPRDWARENDSLLAIDRYALRAITTLREFDISLSFSDAGILAKPRFL